MQQSRSYGFALLVLSVLVVTLLINFRSSTDVRTSLSRLVAALLCDSHGNGKDQASALVCVLLGLKSNFLSYYYY